MKKRRSICSFTIPLFAALLTGGLVMAGHAPPPTGGGGPPAPSGNSETPQPPVPTHPENDCPSPEGGDPIHFATGAELYRATDMTVNGPIPIVVKRLYSSQSTYDSPLGYGWAFQHDRQFVKLGGEAVLVRAGCGWRTKYQLTDGEYVAVGTKHLDAHLASLASGGYELTYPNGRRDIFDTSGRLIRAIDPVGHWLSFQYAPDGPFPLYSTITTEGFGGVSKPIASYHKLLKIESFFADGTSSGKSVSFTYAEPNGRLISAAADDGRKVNYVHDDGGKGQLERVEGLEGKVSTFRYEAPASLKKPFLLTYIQHDVGGEPFINTYDSSGRVTRQKHGLGQIDVLYQAGAKTAVTTTIYDASGKQVRRDIVSYAFDANNYTKENVDANGNKRVHFRNADQRLSRIEYWTNSGTAASPNLQLSRATDYTYDTEGHVLTETVAGAVGAKVIRTYGYDHGRISRREVVSTAEPGKRYVTEYEYDHDAEGRTTVLRRLKERKADDDYRVTEYLYDEKRRLIEVRYANGETRSVAYENGSIFPTRIFYSQTGTELTQKRRKFSYDSRGNVVQIRDGRENLTQYSYDDLGRVVQVTEADGVQKKITYRGELTDAIEFGAKATEPGLVYQYEYNALGQVSRIKRVVSGGADVLLASLEHDTDGHLLKETDASGNVWTYAYDALGNLSTRTDPVGRSWYYRYDTFGNPVLQVDPTGFEERYAYDGAGNLVRHDQLATPPLKTELAYNALGDVLSVTDPAGQTTRYEYDALGRNTAVVKPMGEAIRYVYDGADRVDYKVTEREHKIDYTYAAWGGLTKIEYYAKESATSVKRRIGFTYDNEGNVKSITDNAIKTSGNVYWLSFDSRNRLSVIDAYYLPGVLKRLRSGYDRFGNRSTLTEQTRVDGVWISGRVQQATYDNANRMSELRVDGRMQRAYAWLPDGKLQQVAHASGPTATYGYLPDGALRLVKWEGGQGLIERLGYDYDVLGNIREIEDDAGKARTYRYDELSRLTRADYDEGLSLAPEYYGYDAVGNREDPNQPEYYEYDANNFLVKGGEISYSSDPAGNRVLSGDGAQYMYDYDNRLVEFRKGDVIASYAYDIFGRRVKKTVTVGAGTPKTTWYWWDGSRMVGELDADGNVNRRYVYTDESYNPVQMVDVSGVYDLHQDNLGTPLFATDAEGTVTWRARYQAFGQAVVDEDPDGDGILVTINSRFPGQYFDAETGLHYNYFRTYDPGTGRYLESDPIGLDGGLNTYLYTSANPLSSIDPMGLAEWDPDFWHGQYGQRSSGTNCYGYARNVMSYKNPGDISHVPFPLTCSRLIEGAKNDGLVEAEQEGSCGGTCPDGYYKVQIYLDDTPFSPYDRDYHVYRQDNDGGWSHKRGRGSYPQRAQSCPMTLPRKRGDGSYNKYCGTLCVKID